jgi:hypothetical protein
MGVGCDENGCLAAVVRRLTPTLPITTISDEGRNWQPLHHLYLISSILGQHMGVGCDENGCHSGLRSPSGLNSAHHHHQRRRPHLAAATPLVSRLIRLRPAQGSGVTDVLADDDGKG